MRFSFAMFAVAMALGQAVPPAPDITADPRAEIHRAHVVVTHLDLVVGGVVVTGQIDFSATAETWDCQPCPEVCDQRCAECLPFEQPCPRQARLWAWWEAQGWAQQVGTGDGLLRDYSTEANRISERFSTGGPP